MTDRELVVKIPEETYKNTCNGSMLPPDVTNVINAIKNSTPLPKGHGELVYREDVCNELRYMDNDGYITRRVYHVIEDIEKGVQTIIEADKEA